MEYLENQENLITKVNYSGRVKGVFGMAIFGVPAMALKSLASVIGHKQCLILGAE